MSDIKLNELQKQRLDKLAKIKELKLNSYPQPNLADKNPIAQARELLDQKVLVAGRLMSLRGHGKILFADLQDQTGKIQLFFQEKVLQDKMSLTKLLDLGDIVSISGEVFKTVAGETTINVFEFEILAKNLRPLPEKWHGLQDIEERYRQRYVDLIVNPESREVFKIRTKVLSQMRQFLDDHGFMEVETPILQPVYGGASAKPFITHHNVLDMDMYLRISDELYLKRLIVGGFEKVYEVSRDFRNEGVSRFHNPEFTQIEFYWAYVDYEVLMNFTQELVRHVIKSVKGDLKLKFQVHIFKSLIFKQSPRSAAADIFKNGHRHGRCVKSAKRTASEGRRVKPPLHSCRTFQHTAAGSWPPPLGCNLPVFGIISKFKFEIYKYGF